MNKIEAIKTMLEQSPHLSIAELSRRTGLSRTVFYKWEKGIFKNVHKDSVQKIADATGTNIKIDGNEVLIIDQDIPLEGEAQLQASYIIDLQKDKIKHQHDEIIKLKKALSEKQAESTHWDGLEYDYSTEVTLLRNGLRFGRCIDSVSNINKQSEILGYTAAQLNKLWDVGRKYENMLDHPIENIIDEKTQEEIKKQVKVLPIIFDAMRSMVGDHYIPHPLIYKHKEGHSVGAIAYCKIKWKELKITARVKFLPDCC